MDKQFDELSKSLAEGVSRREALRRFGIGLAGVLLGSVGLASRAEACSTTDCTHGSQCCPGFTCKPVHELPTGHGPSHWCFPG